MSALLSPEDLKRQALANVQDATESNAENPALTALRDSSLAALKAADAGDLAPLLAFARS